MRIVATETVYPCFVNPIEHAGLHGVAYDLHIVIEESHIRPLLLIRSLCRLVPIRMRSYPTVVPRGMVGNPIEHDPHLVFMSRVDQMLEVIHRTESGVDGRIVFYAVRRTYRLAVCAYRMDRHEPQNVYSHIHQGRDIYLNGLECFCLGKEALIALIDNHLIGIRDGLLLGNRKQCTQYKCRYFITLFHFHFLPNLGATDSSVRPSSVILR